MPFKCLTLILFWLQDPVHFLTQPYDLISCYWSDPNLNPLSDGTTHSTDDWGAFSSRGQNLGASDTDGSCSWGQSHRSLHSRCSSHWNTNSQTLQNGSTRCNPSLYINNTDAAWMTAWCFDRRIFYSSKLPVKKTREEPSIQQSYLWKRPEKNLLFLKAEKGQKRTFYSSKLTVEKARWSV